jgi:hypothetical protein
MLMRSSEGSRRVQDALDNATSDGEREAVAREIHGCVVSAMRCPHANHVLQKCLSTLPPRSLQFIVDEITKLTGMAKKLAMHRYGGRIIQQLFGTCEVSQLQELTEMLLRDTVALSTHTFGNYSIQKLLQFGTAEQKYRCVRMLEQNVGSIVVNTHGAGVFAAAMQHSEPLDRIWLARAVAQDPTILPQLAQKRHGVGLVAQVMSELQGQGRAVAYQSLTARMAELQASRYGRKIVAHLQGGICSDAPCQA